MRSGEALAWTCVSGETTLEAARMEQEIWAFLRLLDFRRFSGTVDEMTIGSMLGFVALFVAAVRVVCILESRNAKRIKEERCRVEIRNYERAMVDCEGNFIHSLESFERRQNYYQFFGDLEARYLDCYYDINYPDHYGVKLAPGDSDPIVYKHGL